MTSFQQLILGANNTGIEFLKTFFDSVVKDKLYCFWTFKTTSNVDKIFLFSKSLIFFLNVVTGSNKKFRKLSHDCTAIVQTCLWKTSYSFIFKFKSSYDIRFQFLDICVFHNWIVIIFLSKIQHSPLHAFLPWFEEMNLALAWTSCI